MKIAISAQGADLEAEVAAKFGTSQYLVIVDLDSMAVEAVPNPLAKGQRGAGMQAVVLAISKNVKAVITGYCSPAVHRQLTANGIEVFSGISGTVRDAIERYKSGDFKEGARGEVELREKGANIDRTTVLHALRSSANQFTNILPILVGVVLLIGLFNTFVSEELLSSIFSGNLAVDTIFGACFGSVFAGNPINSYVIGGEALEYGVSLYAVTALIITWVSVGLVQLPAEVAALGGRFALVRNGISFVLAIAIAILSVAVLNLLTE